MIAFPDIVQLAYTSASNPYTVYAAGSEMYVGQTEDVIGLDPAPEDVGIDGDSLVRGGGLFTPRMIEELSDPTLDSDASNKLWTDNLLNSGFTIDDGIY